MGIPQPTGRQMPVSDNSRVSVTVHQVGQATSEQTAEEAAIAWETEVYRQAPVPAPEELLAVPPAAVAPHARAVRAVHPAWGPHAGVVRVVAAGGGNR